MLPDDDWETRVNSNPELITYQLLIFLQSPQSIMVGRMGRFDFPAGNYIYTGSARRNIVARVRRHLSKNKSLRWHVDYLLAIEDARVLEVNFYEEPECRLNQQVSGEVLIPGFGSSDCRSKCRSHLKYLGE